LTSRARLRQCSRTISSARDDPSSASQADILAVGRDLAAALPGASRNPLRAIDDQAMDLASQDAELRAALFRFVDVVPACRSLDDLAATCTASSTRSATARRRCRSRCGCRSSKAGRDGARRRRGGRRQAHGAPLHRRRDAARGDRRARGAVAQRRRHQRRPARRGDGHRAEADRYAARCREALDGSPRSTAAAGAAALERDSAGASRARTCR
jgi:RHH-type proline utilization regulon transcriptional repressor/proline dehydrogenase/delta 1-pyrroline-5-carboxylate dehydrogenase